MAIVLRLDRMMADRKVSLGELAEKVGIADGNLSKLKNGKVSGVRFKTLNAICKELDCNPATSWSSSTTKKADPPLPFPAFSATVETMHPKKDAPCACCSSKTTRPSSPA